jgi:hypothetical protein
LEQRKPVWDLQGSTTLRPIPRSLCTDISRRTLSGRISAVELICMYEKDTEFHPLDGPCESTPTPDSKCVRSKLEDRLEGSL